MKRGFGNIVDRGNGRFLCRWTDIGGNRRSRMVSGTRRDAELLLATVEMQIFGADPSITFGDYWDAVVMQQVETLELKTQYGYRQIWNRELAPIIANRRVSSMSYRMAQSIIDGIESASVQRATARLLSKVCNMAVRDGLLPANPVQRMVFKKHTKREKTVLDHGRVLEYVRAFDGTRHAHLVVLEMCAGLRHEEACALTEDDVAFADGVAYVTIDKARIAIGGSVVDKGPKNDFSARTLPLCGIVASMLETCRIRRINPQTATHNHRQWCARHGVEYIPFGQMRSNFATHACECCEPSLVDLYMGHSGTSTTDRWYRKATEAGLMHVAETYAVYVEGTT